MKEIFPCPINEKDLGIDELLEDLFNDGHYSWNKDIQKRLDLLATSQYWYDRKPTTNCWLDSLAMLGVLMLLRNG